MLLQGSQERALNEWPPSCYYVFMFSFLKTERKIERTRRGALRRRAYTMLLTDYQAIHTMLLVNTARRPRRRRWRRLCGALRELGKKAQTAQQGQLTQAQYGVFCILVCLLLVSKRKLPALHLFVGTDALIQFRQGLGLHFFLARNQRGRELALQIAPAIACTLDFRGQKNNTSSFIALSYFILFSPTKHDVNCGTTQQL